MLDALRMCCCSVRTLTKSICTTAGRLPVLQLAALLVLACINNLYCKFLHQPFAYHPCDMRIPQEAHCSCSRVDTVTVRRGALICTASGVQCVLSDYACLLARSVLRTSVAGLWLGTSKAQIHLIKHLQP